MVTYIFTYIIKYNIALTRTRHPVTDDEETGREQLLRIRLRSSMMHSAEQKFIDDKQQSDTIDGYSLHIESVYTYYVTRLDIIDFR